MYVLLWAKKYIIILLSVVQFFFLVVNVALYITHRPREKRNKRYRHKKQREKHSVYYTLHTNREMKFLLQKQKQEKKTIFSTQTQHRKKRKLYYVLMIDRTLNVEIGIYKAQKTLCIVNVILVVGEARK